MSVPRKSSSQNCCVQIYCDVAMMVKEEREEEVEEDESREVEMSVGGAREVGEESVGVVEVEVDVVTGGMLIRW